MKTTPSILTRVYEFETLAEALASNQLFGTGSILRIKGDDTKFKFAFGQKYSGSEPSGATAKTFSQFPWVYSDGSTSKTPFTSYAQNATGTISAANLLKKFITSTSAAATTATLPTATQLATALGLSNPTAKGTEFDFTVDNSAGANTVTVAVGSGITVPTAVLTGADTLTVAAGGFGKFKIIFKSATVALLYRVL